MPTDQRITVRGVAERQATADIAALNVVVQVDSGDQTSAFERASELAAAADAVLDARASALGPRQAASVLVQPLTRWVDGEEQRTGWRALRTSTIDVLDPAQLTPLIAELVGCGAIVHGPSWRLRLDHPVFTETRAAAANDARARAETYATGLGVRVGRVEWAAEPGLRLSSGGAGGVEHAVSLAAKTRGAAADSGMAVETAELTVTAAVDVAFALERG